MTDVIHLLGAVRIIRSQPDFETKAEDAMKSAEAELEHALKVVRDARKQFSTKPVAA
jgi:hypothetical protein